MKKYNSFAEFLLARWKENYEEALREDDPIKAIYCLGVGDGYAEALTNMLGKDAKELFPGYEEITDKILEKL